MLLFEWTIALLLGAVLLTMLARRAGAPYPSLLALGGAALALVPGGPRIVLDPELALALFIAPVLLDAGYDTSLRDLRENWVPVGGLVLVAVAVTTAAVAWTAHALVPGLPWAAAVALGAIVAPPDAAAATAVLRQVRPPHRIMTILEGESLLNDASALLVYRLAVAAAAAGTFAAGRVLPTLLFTVGGGLLAGTALARAYMRLTARIEDVPSSVVLQFVSTFGVWILAERLGLSAVITLVSYAATLGRYAPDRVPARQRVPSYAVWDTAVFVLNVLAFVLVGLQIRPILERLAPDQRREYFVVAGLVLATVIVARVVWVMAYNTAARWKVRRFGARTRRPMLGPTVAGGLVISWCGMRGIVTLAAALALPDGREGPAFPYRDLLVLTAFCVVVGTLTVQGLTLKPLLTRLRFADDGEVEREVNAARAGALRAAVASLEAEPALAEGDGAAAEVVAVRREYEAVLAKVTAAPDGDVPDALPGDGARRRAVRASRRAISELRARGEIGDDAFHRVEEQLDWLEMGAGGARADADGSA